MKWWNIIPDAPCIFAIDSESLIDKDKITFTNNPNRFLTYTNGKSKALSLATTGYKYKDLQFEKPLKTYTYKSLNIWDTQLTFDIPVALPNEFTFILKVKVNKTSVFLSNNGQNYGLVFGLDGVSASSWHIAITDSTGSRETETMKKYSKGHIQTVILKGNLISRNTSLITDYGVTLIGPESPSYTGSNFLVSRTYTTLGHTSTDTARYLNSDIVAYGLFAKNMSDEEVNTVLQTIDEQFLENTSKVSFNPINTISPKPPLPSNTQIYQPKYLYNFLKAGESEIAKPTRMLIREFEQPSFIRQLYKNYETIEDHVYEEGIPVQTTLFLYEKQTGQLIKTTISDKNGYFVFYNLKEEQEYIVTAKDNKYQFKSIVKDYNN